MPIYEYQCEKCCERFSLLQPMSAAREGYRCPSCGKTKTRRVMSSFAQSGRESASAASCGPASSPFR